MTDELKQKLADVFAQVSNEDYSYVVWLKSNDDEQLSIVVNGTEAWEDHLVMSAVADISNSWKEHRAPKQEL